jgi:hypothetical protein
MKRKLNSVALIGLLVLCSANFVCTSRYQKCAQAVNNISLGNEGLQIAAKNARLTGMVTSDEDIQVQQIVKKVAAVNMKLGQATLKANSGDKTWTADMTVALNLAADLNANSLLFIKNPTAQAELTAIIAGIRLSLDVIAAAINYQTSAASQGRAS